MRILLLSLGITFLSSLLPASLGFAAPCDDTSAKTNITCPGFIISLQSIDPVNTSSTTLKGKYALIGEDQSSGLLKKIADLLLFAIPLIAGVSLIIAGYYYILSSGDSEKTTKAKTIIKWNLVAIVVALFSYTLIYLVASTLDGTLL